MPPRRTRNSLESFVPPVSSASVSAASVTTNAFPTSAQASGTPASASISPEFLASVIQAIQTPISAIVQQLLSAVVSTHSVSRGLPTIAAQGSSLATCAAHLDACGFHQPWSPSAPTGCLPSTSSSSTPPEPAATPTHVLTGMSLLFLVVPFCFGLSYNCKSYGGSLAGSLTSSTAFRGRSRLLTSTFQDCFSNHGRKVRASGRFVSRKHYHAQARAATLVQWPVSVVAHAEKAEASDYRHRVMDGTLFHFLSHSLLVFPTSMERSDKLQAFNSPNISSV